MVMPRYLYPTHFKSYHLNQILYKTAKEYLYSGIRNKNEKRKIEVSR